MIRLAAAFLLVSQLVLLWFCLLMTGRASIALAFLGHPTLGIGVALGAIALIRRARQRENGGH